MMAEWFAHWTPNQKIMGLNPAKASCLFKNCPIWATCEDNGASVHSVINEYLATEMAIVLRLPVEP